MDTFLLDLLYHGSGVGDAGALDNLIGIEDFLLAMMSLFPFNLMVIQLLLVFVGNLRHV